MNGKQRSADTAHFFECCPDCGQRDFLIDERDGDVVFRCLGCSTGWRYALGYVWRVADQVGREDDVQITA